MENAKEQIKRRIFNNILLKTRKKTDKKLGIYGVI
jgi:hypothetical protein